MKKQKYSVSVIGVGNIGRRHVEAILKSSFDIRLFCVDPAIDTLERLKKAFVLEKIPKNIEISYLSNVEELPPTIDLAIIATTSDVRAVVVESLTKTKKVKNLILEKVLFSKISEYKNVSYIIKKKKINCWVNCPRRVWPIYQHIKKNIDNSEFLQMIVTGSNFGLASNAIHFLDLFSYITGSLDLALSSQFLDKKAIKGKRKGFIEVTGTIFGKSSERNFFSATSNASGESPVLVEIANGPKRIFINETEGEYLEISKNNKVIRKKIIIPYQSELTCTITEKLLKEGKCNLSTYSESSILHLSLLAALKNYFQGKRRWQIT